MKNGERKINWSSQSHIEGWKCHKPVEWVPFKWVVQAKLQSTKAWNPGVFKLVSKMIVVGPTGRTETVCLIQSSVSYITNFQHSKS